MIFFDNTRDYGPMIKVGLAVLLIYISKFIKELRGYDKRNSENMVF